MIFLNFLSLAGLPPFLGFFLKLRTLNILIKASYNLIIPFALISASLVAFYFYSRVIYSSFFSFEGNIKIMALPPEAQDLIPKVILIALAGNLLISLLVVLS